MISAVNRNKANRKRWAGGAAYFIREGLLEEVDLSRGQDKDPAMWTFGQILYKAEGTVNAQAQRSSMLEEERKGQ